MLGLGFATFIEAAPGPPEFLDVGDAGGRDDGGDRSGRARCSNATARCRCSRPQMPHGQGHETTLAQVAADELGVPIEQVRVRYGDTNLTPFSLMGTGGSRSAPMAGGAVTYSARSLREEILDLAADMLEAPRDDLVIEDGAIHVRGVPADLAHPRRRRRSRARTRPEATARRGVAHRSGVRRRRGWMGAGHARVLGRGRPQHRPRAHPALRRGRGLRRAHQPGGGRRPDRRRRGPGHRRGALREVGLRRPGAVPGGHVHGLPAARPRWRCPTSRSTTSRRRPTSRSTTAAWARAG